MTISENRGLSPIIQSTADPNVFFVKLDDGTTINVRSVSNSTLADGTSPRWTLDVKNNPKLGQLNPNNKTNNFELKFK